GTGLYNFGSAGEAAERSDAQTGNNDRDVVGETTNPDVANKDSYATGSGLYVWNSGEETDNPNVANKDSYQTGTGLYNFGPAGEAAERSDAQTGNNDRDVVGETTNPDVANKGSYATGSGLYVWNSGEETTNPNVADKDSYTNGDSLVQHEGVVADVGRYVWNSGAESSNPNVAFKPGYTNGSDLTYNDESNRNIITRYKQELLDWIELEQDQYLGAGRDKSRDFLPKLVASSDFSSLSRDDQQLLANYFLKVPTQNNSTAGEVCVVDPNATAENNAQQQCKPAENPVSGAVSNKDEENKG
ncbi:hypothetical protein CJP74_07750, partial [Psittacicella melopsittaci]